MPRVARSAWAFTPLALSFRPVELAAMAVAAALPALVLRTGRTTRLSGAILLAAYSAVAVACSGAGDRCPVRAVWALRPARRPSLPRRRVARPPVVRPPGMAV